MSVKEQCRCVVVECGAQCVMTTGAPVMQVLYAHNLTLEKVVSKA